MPLPARVTLQETPQLLLFIIPIVQQRKLRLGETCGWCSQDWHLTALLPKPHGGGLAWQLGPRGVVEPASSGLEVQTREIDTCLVAAGCEYIGLCSHDVCPGDAVDVPRLGGIPVYGGERLLPFGLHLGVGTGVLRDHIPAV